jgi:seryl-tRNA synthetase
LTRLYSKETPKYHGGPDIPQYQEYPYQEELARLQRDLPKWAATAKLRAAQDKIQPLQDRFFELRDKYNKLMNQMANLPKNQRVSPDFWKGVKDASNKMVKAKVKLRLAVDDLKEIRANTRTEEDDPYYHAEPSWQQFGRRGLRGGYIY